MTLEVIEQQMADLKVRFAEFNLILMEVRDRQLTGGVCPQPGLCVDLRSRIISLELQMETLQTDRLVVVRGWKAIGIVAAVASAIVTAGYGAWQFIEHIMHKKP